MCAACDKIVNIPPAYTGMFNMSFRHRPQCMNFFSHTESPFSRLGDSL